MKIERRIYVEQVIKSNPMYYKDFDILLITDKCMRQADKIKLKRDKVTDDNDKDSLIKSYDKMMDMVLSTLPERKFLLLESDNDGMVFEYIFKDDIFMIKSHIFMFGEHMIYEYSYVKGFGIVKFSPVKEYTKSQMEPFENRAIHVGCPSFGSFIHTIVHDVILRQVIFIELSKEMVKYRVIQPKSKTGQIMKGTYVNNLSDVRLILVDSLWYTKTIGIGNFEVSGHFRLQPCGVNFSKVKLIYIEQYYKTHYIRKSTRELTFGEPVLQ